MSTFFNPYWLEPGAAVPVDIATTAALVTEIQRLRQALAQPEQEPVAWVTAKESFCGFPKLVFSETQKYGYKPLYAAPVRTKDLTDEEIEECVHIADSECTEDACMPWFVEFARAVIAADREKNNANNNS